MTDEDYEVAGEMQTAICVAIGKILDGDSPEEVLEWAVFALPHLMAGSFEAIDPADHRRAAFWIGVAIWNSAPNPGNHFKPSPLPKPQRNARCPCGSGLKFKQCCAGSPMPEEIPVEIYWHLMPEVCSKAQINRLAVAGELPVDGIAILAGRYYDEGDFAQVIKLLEPLFSGDAKRLNHRHGGLLDLLCDSYNQHYSTERKKRELLDRMSRHREKIIRSEAWQRLAAWQQDQGNLQAASEALAEAMRADPDNPSHALLELTLLTSSGEHEKARQRATFWHARLKRHAQEFPELVETLEMARRDPLGALKQTTRLASEQGDDRLARILRWLARDLPAAQYHVESLVDGQILAGNENANNQDHPLTLDMFAEEGPGGVDAPAAGELERTHREDPLATGVVLHPPARIASLERLWHEVCPVDKPFSTSFDVPGAEETWADPLDDEWLCFLERHPEAVNSLDVMDDVVSLLYAHPLGDTAYGPMDDCWPLLRRAWDILDSATIPAGRTLPWVVPENRPALRLLAHEIMALQHSDGNETAAMERAASYLRLNPHDNHGFRCQLVNYYLRQGRDEKAFAICSDYPDDMMADTRYGHVLALYRLGDLDGAARLLGGAKKDLPLVREFLVRERIRKPRLNEFGVTLGGKDQAWLYRQEMRDCWLETAGSLEWLKKH